MFSVTDTIVAIATPPGRGGIGIVRDVYGGDSDRVRTWLRTPRPELEGQTPIDAMCVPSGIQRVIQFVLGAWLRNAD